MKLIIAGGRDYSLTAEDIRELDRMPITEVVSGGATGADMSGEHYAEQRGLPVKKFMADWKSHGRGAGPIRNRLMADYADGVALFPGGRGTASMYAEAKKTGIEIFDFCGY